MEQREARITHLVQVSERLRQCGWKHSMDVRSHKGLFILNIRAGYKESAKECNMRILIKDDFISSRVYLGECEEKYRLELAELAIRLNYQMLGPGRFDFDLEDGDLSFYSKVMTYGVDVLPEAMLKQAVSDPMEIVEGLDEKICGVMNGYIGAYEASCDVVPEVPVGHRFFRIIQAGCL